MSELRERLNEFIDTHGLVAGLPKDMLVAKLEAFAKAEQIKGMEAVLQEAIRQHVDIHYIAWLDEQIIKLKEGG